MQQALLQGVEVTATELRLYIHELAQALRALTKPAPAATKAMICEAMAPVWDMRSNCANHEAAFNLRVLASAVEALGKCGAQEATQEHGDSSAVETVAQP